MARTDFQRDALISSPLEGVSGRWFSFPAAMRHSANAGTELGVELAKPLREWDCAPVRSVAQPG